LLGQNDAAHNTLNRLRARAASGGAISPNTDLPAVSFDASPLTLTKKP
jgi:hypothetical protein